MGIGPRRSSNSGIPGVAVGRRSYPSGPWVDAYGNVVPSPNASYSSPPPPAPVVKAPDGNPNPNNWKLLQAKEIGSYLILEMQYPDCLNYEGKKILVFEGIKLIDLVNQKLIDPHFFPANKKFKSPIARFEPTPRGWMMAEVFATQMGAVKSGR